MNTSPARIACLRAIGATACLLFGSGCATLQYYAQSISGQMEVLSHRQKIDDVLDNPGTSPGVRRSLGIVREITAFAHETLLLPDNGSYDSYAELRRPYVAWNVFATPELSLDPLRWCFPIAGCLSYRGYFDRADAEAFAGRLAARGYDVHVAGVAGYSTLGWFRDPVLDSMLRRTDAELARLLFHELAHQKLYLSGDTELNEAFADAVALIGVRRWIGSSAGRADPLFERDLAVETDFVNLALAYRSLLRGIYGSAIDEDTKRARKKMLFAAFEADHGVQKLRSGDAGTYDDWFASGLGNARLAALSTYRELVPLFLELYDSSGGNLELFYAQVESLRSCDPGARIQSLREGRLPAEC
ncbi:MAG TPA: aminopeptidase [Gammaproteobacteria bacterium]